MRSLRSLFRCVCKHRETDEPLELCEQKRNAENARHSCLLHLRMQMAVRGSVEPRGFFGWDGRYEVACLGAFSSCFCGSPFGGSRVEAFGGPS
jgi:hypothetical protein